MGLEHRRGPRYRPREAYAVRPTAAAAAEDPFARTALDPPRFTVPRVQPRAPSRVRASAPVAPHPRAREAWGPVRRVAFAVGVGVVAGSACAMSFWLAAFGGWG